MTSFPSAADRSVPRRGFTLVELLVVIGILVLLIAITMAFIGRAQRQAELVKAKTELNAIAAGIEQFKTDHGFYPMANDPQPVLAEAMIAPGGKNDLLKLFPGKKDMVDGPGFMVNGKTWQPYLPADAYLVERESPTRQTWLLLDRYDNPIVYMPKRKNLPPNLPPGMPFKLVEDAPSGSAVPSLFDLRDANKYNRSPKPNSVWDARMVRALLGDDNLSNRIDPNETITNIPNYILASPGPDREFTTFEPPPSGRSAGEWNRARMRKSDDVFNIEP